MTPDQYTIRESYLDVGDGHQLYVHAWGNPHAALPIIYLHGGPGGGCSDRQKQLFDPTRQKVIFFDQRGAGRSLPYGSLDSNTTDDIVKDISKIADDLEIKQFVLTGGSWGSALAFFYAIKYPKRVAAMVLDGIWTGTKAENDWIDAGGFRTFYPDAWDDYVATAPKQYHENPSGYHFPRILGDDEQASKASGYAYEKLEGSAISLDDRHSTPDFETYDPAGIRIEVNYLVNQCFMPDRYILKHASSLTMPIYLIQGRYDMVCPPKTAYELQQLLPNSELIMTTSGHLPERETWNIKRSLLLQITESSHD